MQWPSLRAASAVSRRIYDWLRGSSPALVPLALLVGAGAGGGAVLFRYLIDWLSVLFTGRADYGHAAGASSPHFPGLGPFFLLVAPIIGGLVYGPLVARFAPEARGHGVPEVMLAIAERGGRMGPRVVVVKSLASALCIGSGGSVGREGPIVQVGSALGSALGQTLKMPESRLRLLVACGAAGGISATFNAPIAGVFFALELILRNFRTEAFGVVVLASVTADVIGRAAFGQEPFLSLPSFELSSPLEYLLYAGLGMLAAAGGVLFTKVLYGVEDIMDWLWRGPEWLRPAAGGVLLGAVLFALPQMYGVGYAVLENAVRGEYVLWFLLVLLAGKILATSVTIAIGGSGGVFAPSLFMGAMLGVAYGLAVNAVFPAVAGSPGAYGIVGMGAVFAGAARAPITAVLIIFELTGSYAIILPLMFAISLAAGVSNLLSRDTVYTLKLRRRGIDVLRGRSANLMEVLTVGDAMQPVPHAVTLDAPLNTVIERLADEQRDALPVTDEAGVYRGTVTARQVEDSARQNALESSAGSLAETMPSLTADQTLEQALSVLVDRDRFGMPVLSVDGREILGWITHRDVLRAYSNRLQRNVEKAGEGPEEPSEASIPPSPSPAVRPPTVQRSLARLQGYRIVEVELARNRPPVGTPVADVNVPPRSLVIAIRRKGAPLSATPETRLRQGDRVSFLVPAEHADRIAETISQRPGQAR